MPLRAPKGFIDESDPKVCQIGHPAPPWLVNYADLMTEMVCFFVILYALSAVLNKDVQQAVKDVEEAKKNIHAEIDVKIDREGMKISIQEKGDMAFFASGKADVTAGMLSILDQIAPTIKNLSKNFDIVVEGHTDNVPINDEYFGSNWELSSARATTVVEYLIKDKDFSPQYLAAMGYGQYRPVCPANDTPECKAKNRRVVFFVKTVTPHGAPPSPGAAPASSAGPGEGVKAPAQGAAPAAPPAGGTP
ncbi:MAG: flagellar motor protein MotB [Elusimicrobia bacterium]|nr:flagellar motor protein MotB [Elusimicrobiota bacterium]